MPYHETLRPMWLRRTVRGLLLFTYTSFLLAGIAALLTPPASMREGTSHTVTVLWGVWILAGAAGGVVGVSMRRPGWELLGTVPLAGSWLAYGAVLLKLAWDTPGLVGPSTVAAWLCVAFASLISYRGAVLLGSARRWEVVAA